MPKSKYPLVTIIILNWNGKKLLKTCLSSLFKLTDYPNYKVIVVDNGSTDGSVEYVKKCFSKADVLALDKNYGYAKGNNEGIKYALKKYNPDYVLLLNNDTKIIQKNWLTEMVKVAESNEKIGIVGNVLLYDNNTVQMFGGGIDWFGLMYQYFVGEDKEVIEKCYSKPLKVSSVMFACVLIRKELFQKNVFLDESFKFYFEDTDYCWRTYLKGYYIAVTPKSSIIHFSGVSSKKVEKKSTKRFRYHQFFDNKFKAFHKNLPFLMKIILLPIWFVVHSFMFLPHRIAGYKYAFLPLKALLDTEKLFTRNKTSLKRNAEFFSFPLYDFKYMNPLKALTKFVGLTKK